MTKRKIEYWVIPPEQDGEFVACMEDVLETYAAAYERVAVVATTNRLEARDSLRT